MMTGEKMTTINMQTNVQLDRGQWFQLGLIAAVAAVIVVLIVQWVAIAIWPQIALFKPLDSYARTALFTFVPAVGATAVFAWLARRKTNPVPGFLTISVVVLLLSIIPDYLLPVEYKTFLASSVTAVLHMVAAAIIVSVLVAGYRRQTGA
jgi:magnesium-transporting ATPase (P-type)